jgi:hypothetical protein
VVSRHGFLIIAAIVRAGQKTHNLKLEPKITEPEPKISETRISFEDFR